MDRLLFALVAGWVLLSALGVVFLRNVMHAAGALMVCFVGVAALYITLKAELIAALQVVLYVGAITVILLFGIMLTLRRVGDVREAWNRRALRLAPWLVAVLGIVLAAAFSRTDWPTAAERQVPSVGEVADRLFRPDGWVLPFEIVGILLLSALVGAIALARREKKAP